MKAVVPRSPARMPKLPPGPQHKESAWRGAGALRCACGGTCPGCTLPTPGIGAPGDAWEKAADRMADRLMADRTDHPFPRVHTPAANAATGTTGNTGQPLPEPLAATFSQRLGADLASVRVHAGSRAAALCDGIHARAFTRGTDVYFNRGEYRPAEAAGQRVLAHELAHVVQQRDSAAPSLQRLPALNESSEANVIATQVHPWPGQAPVGNDYRLATDAGSSLSAWVAYSGQPEADRYWCHGHSLGTFSDWGYSVYSGGPMGRVIQDEFQRVAAPEVRAGDLAVWLQTDSGAPYGHSARITQPVLAGAALDPAQTQLSSKNGRQPLGTFTLAQLTAIPEYGANVGLFRRR